MPGRRPSVAVPHRSASPALCPCGHPASFSSSCVVVRVWCLESAALLQVAVLGERARCVRRAVRRACTCCCPVAAAATAAARALGLSRCRQERQIRPVFANMEIFGAVFRRIHSEKAKYMPQNSHLAPPKFAFDVPGCRASVPCKVRAQRLRACARCWVQRRGGGGGGGGGVACPAATTRIRFV